MKKLNLFLLVLILSSAVFAQDSTSITDMTNNLGLVNGTKTINKGALFAGIAYSRSKTSTVSNHGLWEDVFQGLPGLDLAYGIGERIDVRISTNFVKHRWEYLEYSGSDFNGIIIEISSKINIIKQKGWIPEVAIDAGFKRIHYSSSRLYAPVGIAFKYDLGKRFDLSGGIMSTSLQGGALAFVDIWNYHDDIRFRWALESSFEIIKNLSIYASVKTLNPMQHETYWNTGLFYQINHTFLIHMELSKYTEPPGALKFTELNHNRFNAGFSWLMFNK